MARNLLAFPFKPYLGSYISKPFNDARGKQKGVMVALDILWSQYIGAADQNYSINFNMNAIGTSNVPAGWFVQSVYIDNDAVDFPVYVYFGDTGFTVTCPANTAGWFQVYTAQRAGIVSAVNISPNAIPNSQRTRLFFTDAVMQPFTEPEINSSADLWLASTGISKFATAGYATPALGDQHLQVSNNLFTGGAIVAFLAQPNINFLYITQIQAVLHGLTPAAAGRATATVVFQGGGTNNITVFPDGGASASPFPNPCILLDLKGNLRLDAGNSYACNVLATNNVGAGFVDWHFMFTYSNF